MGCERPGRFSTVTHYLFISKTVLIMLILQLALGAFLLGGGIITLTNWVAEKLERNSIHGSR